MLVFKPRHLHYTLLLALIVAAPSIWAQHTFTKGSHSVELRGLFSGFYNHRLLKDSVPDSISTGQLHLKDLQFQIKGVSKNKFSYELHVDIADLTDSVINIEDPGLLAANITFHTLVNLSLGYSKIPYSRSNLIPFFDQVFWQRSALNQGGFWSRRDLGITLDKSFSNNKGSVQAGMYSGYGEYVIKHLPDLNTNLEYAARVQYAFLGPLPYQAVDYKTVPKPLLAVGLNARYCSIEDGYDIDLAQGIDGAYGLRRVEGTKLTYGLDLAFQYQGWSFLYEIHQMRLAPLALNSPIFQGQFYSLHQGKIKSGGYSAELSYYAPQYKSIVFGRYENYNINNLASGINRTASLGFAYQLQGFKSMLKLQALHNLEEETINPQNFSTQVRVGWQYQF